MPVASYIAFPFRGEYEKMMADLSHLKQCDVIPSMGKELVVLVTDTTSAEEEEKLSKKLEALTSIQCLSLTYGSVLVEKEEAL